jgi:hypothetical protein
MPVDSVSHAGDLLEIVGSVAYTAQHKNTRFKYSEQMGCDGGSIPKRDEMVRTKKKDPKVDETEKQRVKWLLCALSDEPLNEPVVCDCLGNLFNKEALINRLLEKKMEGFTHIRSLKDVVTLQMAKNPNYKPDEVTDYDNIVFPFICPITGYEANGKHRFSAIRTCGHVFSDKALAEVPSSTCLLCQTPYTKDDLIPLNPPDDEQRVLKEKLALANREKKKEKKHKQKHENSSASVDNNNVNTNTNNGPNQNGVSTKDKKRKYSQVTEDESKKPSIQPLIAVQVALEKANEYHEKYSKTSEAYRSLFKRQHTGVDKVAPALTSTKV